MTFQSALHHIVAKELEEAMRANSKWIRMEQPGMRWADHEDVEDLFELHRHVNIFQAQFCLGFGAKTVQS